MRSIFAQIIMPTSIAGVLMLLDSIIPSMQIFHTYKWGLLIFFFIQSLLSSLITDFGMKTEGVTFQKFYMLSITIRLFLSILLIFVFIYLKVENLIFLVTNFFALYFFYMLFEIYFLLVNLRTNSKQIQKTEK